LGDLKIVSHGAVFDVVRQAWPGKYQYDYNPFSGTIYNNMFLTFDIEQGSSRNKRQMCYTWDDRIVELADPRKLVKPQTPHPNPQTLELRGVAFNPETPIETLIP